jgi:hypothetical protein
MAGTAGLEPATSRFVGGCSVQLSYVSIDKMVPRVGFEPTSPALQAGAFTRLASQAINQGASQRAQTKIKWKTSQAALAAAIISVSIGVPHSGAPDRKSSDAIGNRLTQDVSRDSHMD